MGLYHGAGVLVPASGVNASSGSPADYIYYITVLRAMCVLSGGGVEGRGWRQVEGVIHRGLPGEVRSPRYTSLQGPLRTPTPWPIPRTLPLYIIIPSGRQWKAGTAPTANR